MLLFAIFMYVLKNEIVHGGKKYLTVLKFLIQWVINCYCQHLKMAFSVNPNAIITNSTLFGVIWQTLHIKHCTKSYRIAAVHILFTVLSQAHWQNVSIHFGLLSALKEKLSSMKIVVRCLYAGGDSLLHSGICCKSLASQLLLK